MPSFAVAENTNCRWNIKGQTEQPDLPESDGIMCMKSFSREMLPISEARLRGSIC